MSIDKCIIMNTILNNVSAICVTEIKQSPYIIFGTKSGEIGIYDPQTSSNELIYKFESGQPVLQITRYDNLLGILVQGDMRPDEDGINEYSKVYHLNLKNLSAGAKCIGRNADHMFDPFAMLMYNSILYGVYMSDQDKVVFIKNLEYFDGSAIYDQLGFCLAINRHMTTASVYTLRLDDLDSWQPDTFSYDSDFMCKIGAYLQMNPVDCEDPDDIIVEQEQIMNVNLPSNLVRSAHQKFTYIDFIKLYDSGDKNNPFVVTGGRDHRVIITDFNDHKVLFDQDFGSIPRACAHNDDKIFVVGNDGMIMTIDKSDYSYFEMTLGEERFKCVEALPSGNHIVAVNTDDVVFCVDMDEQEVKGFFDMNEKVNDVAVLSNCFYVLGESGKLVEIEY